MLVAPDVETNRVFGTVGVDRHRVPIHAATPGRERRQLQYYLASVLGIDRARAGAEGSAGKTPARVVSSEVQVQRAAPLARCFLPQALHGREKLRQRDG